MWCIWICMCFILLNSVLSAPMKTNNEFDHYRQIRATDHNDQINNNIAYSNISSVSNDTTTASICSVQTIDIDKPSSAIQTDSNMEHSTSTTITTIDIVHFVSSWQRKSVKDDDESDEEHSTALNIIQVIFTIPFTILNDSIVNKTVFITDVKHNQLLAVLTDICINESSFIINYSTVQPLPHNICLYLLLNLTSSATLREIIFCRTIDYLYGDTSSSQDNQADSSHAVGPSGFFILSQCIIILIMMCIIYVVQTARQKSLVNRVGQRLVHSRPYITVFGHKASVRATSNTVHAPTDSTSTLRAGLNQLILHRHLPTLPGLQENVPIEEQVLAANDLTSTIYDRKASRPMINRDLIDVKEFTKRIHGSHDSSANNELHSMSDIRP